MIFHNIALLQIRLLKRFYKQIQTNSTIKNRSATIFKRFQTYMERFWTMINYFQRLSNNYISWDIEMLWIRYYFNDFRNELATIDSRSETIWKKIWCEHETIFSDDNRFSTIFHRFYSFSLTILNRFSEKCWTITHLAFLVIKWNQN